MHKRTIYGRAVHIFNFLLRYIAFTLLLWQWSFHFIPIKTLSLKISSNAESNWFLKSTSAVSDLFLCARIGNFFKKNWKCIYQVNTKNEKAVKIIIKIITFKLQSTDTFFLFNFSFKDRNSSSFDISSQLVLES